MGNIAFEEELHQRIQKIAKERYDIELSLKEVEELENIVSKYIKHKMGEDSNLFGVYMRGLGSSYYTRIACNKKRSNTYTDSRKKSEMWKRRSEAITEFYENNDSKKNRKKGFRVYHVEPPIIKRASRKGFTVEDIEEIQNNIE